MENVDVKALIAKARAELDAPTDDVKDDDSLVERVPVEVAGESVEIVFRRAAGHVWSDLTATHPPRKGSTQDQNVGYNTDGAAAAYPLELVRLAGEPVDAETWADLLAVLSSPSLKLIAAGLWGLNQLRPSQRLAELGKASAGGSRKKRN